MKASKDVVERRLSIVVAHLTIGLQKKKIYESLRIKEQDEDEENKLWNITYRMFQEYCKKAEQFIIKQINKNREYYVARGVARYDDIFVKLYSAGDYKGAMMAQEKLEKLLQLGSGISINVNSFNGEIPNNIKDIAYIEENSEYTE